MSALKELAFPDGLAQHNMLAALAGDAPNDSAPWKQPLTRPAACDHIAHVCRDERFLVEAVAHFVGAGLERGDGVLVIPTPGHWDAIRRRLESDGIDVEAALGKGQLSVLDAELTLAQILISGMPDWTAFKTLVGGMIELIRQRHGSVRAFGEMVDLLQRDGNCEATIRLEEFWNRIIRFHGISLLCAYQMDTLDAGAYGGPLEDICRAHTHLIPARDYGQLDFAVAEASGRVLDASLVGMLHTLAHIDQPQTKMPFGQAVLLWLRKNMPVTADRVLAQVRALCGRPDPLSHDG